MKLFSDIYRNKKVLVTGHTGFKGSWLCAWLQQMGAEVYGLSHEIPTKPSHFEMLDKAIVDHYQGDILNAKVVDERILTIQPDFVFHLAAQAIVSESMANPVSTIQTNAIGTAHVLDALRKLTKPCAAIFITSDKCYENVETFYGYRETDALGGKDPYSASKAAAECVFHAFYCSYFLDSNVKIATARAGNVIGGGDWAKDRLIPDLVTAWHQKRPAKCRKPNATRPWQHVLEPLSGYLLLGQHLATNQHSGASFNFGPRAEDIYSVQALIGALTTSLTELTIDYIDNTEIHDAGLLKLNCDFALNKLGWQPVFTFSETVEKTADWYRHYYDSNQRSILTTDQIKTYCQLAKQRGHLWSL